MALNSKETIKPAEAELKSEKNLYWPLTKNSNGKRYKILLNYWVQVIFIEKGAVNTACQRVMKR